MVECCKKISDWLGAFERNTAFVYWKGDKEIAAIIICCTLILTNAFDSVESAIDHFTELNGRQKVTPSQRRWIEYHYRILKEYGGILPSPPKFRITRIRVTERPKISGIPFVIVHQPSMIFSTKYISNDKDLDSYEIDINCVVQGEFKVQVCHKKSHTQDMAFYFCLSTLFVQKGSFSLKKDEVDIAHEDAKCDAFGNRFSLEIVFDPLENDK